MQKIIYYVASSIDAYISGANDDISLFSTASEGVQQYLSDLNKYRTVIMGRKTYEFAYQYGLDPGQKAYPNMKHYIFSNQLKFDSPADGVFVEKLSVDKIIDIKTRSETDVYLCGGGELAGWLLERDLIDVVKLKLNPIILGSGISLFGSANKASKMKLSQSKVYDDGLQILTYELTI